MAPMWALLIKQHAVSPTSSALSGKRHRPWVTCPHCTVSRAGTRLSRSWTPGRYSLLPRTQKEHRPQVRGIFLLELPSSEVKTVTETWGPIPLQLHEPGQELSTMLCLIFLLLITYCKRTPGRKTTLVATGVSANMQTPVLNSQRCSKDKPACDSTGPTAA